MGLYGFSELFPASLKLLPIFIIPGCVVGLFIIMPLIGRWFIGYVFSSLVILGLLIGNFVLTAQVANHDAANEDHQIALQEGDALAKRAKELVRGPQGIPATGALTLLRNDPKTVGPKLFKQHCRQLSRPYRCQGRGYQGGRIECTEFVRLRYA